MRRNKFSFLVIAPVISSGTLFSPEAAIDGVITKYLKPVNSHVRAGEIIAYMNQKDGNFSFDEVPVRAPISGTLKTIYFQSNAQVNKGQKLFVVDPQIE